MSNISKGAVLGLTNTLVLAAGYSDLAHYQFHDRHVPSLPALFVLGAIPGAMLGGLLGELAGRVRDERIGKLLLASFATIGCFVLVCLPLVRGYDDWQLAALIALAWVPTSFATLVLERWTRPPALASAWVLDRPGSGSESPERRARTASCT